MKRAALPLVLFVLMIGEARPQAAPPATQPAPSLPQITLEKYPPVLREKVRDAYDRALAHPLDPAANGRLGMILQAYDQGDSTAEVCFRRARAAEPSSFRWAYYLGLDQAEQKRYADAVATLRNALELKPGYLPAELKLAQCLLSSGEVEPAHEVLEGALHRDSSNARIFFELGRVEEARGNLKGAAQSFRKASELFPHYGGAYYSLALADQHLGHTDLAREELRLAEEYKYESPDPADPLMADLRNLYTDPNYFAELGVQAANRGNLEVAVGLHEKALLIDPNLLLAHVNLISLYGRLRNFDKAEEHYRSAITIDPNNAKAHYDYGVLLMEQGRISDAKEAFEKTLEVDPDNASAHNSLGDVLQRGGNLQDALAHFRRAILSKPDFPQAHFNLGRILVNQGKYQDGIPELMRALDSADDDARPSYLYAVGAAYVRAGDVQKGLLYLHKARDQAAQRHESKLVESIDRDVKSLQVGKTHD